MKRETFNKMLKDAGFTKKEFAEKLNVSTNTVNGWGSNKNNIPYWVESWLNNSIELKKLKEEIKTRKQFTDLLHQQLEKNGITIETQQKLSGRAEDHIKDISVFTKDVMSERDTLKKLIRQLIQEELDHKS